MTPIRTSVCHVEALHRDSFGNIIFVAINKSVAEFPCQEVKSWMRKPLTTNQDKLGHDTKHTDPGQ